MVKCSGHTRSGTACAGIGTIRHRGDWYCHHHVPDRKPKPQDQDPAFVGRQARRKLRRDRIALERDAGLRPDQVRHLTDDQVRAIARAGGLMEGLDMIPAPRSPFLGKPVPDVHHGPDDPATAPARLALRLQRLEAFARAQERWEADFLNHDGPWADGIPGDLHAGFLEVQRLRNEALSS